jgi:hypothetical protein
MNKQERIKNLELEMIKLKKKIIFLKKKLAEINVIINNIIHGKQVVKDKNEINTNDRLVYFPI